jgi:hypothetical protein
MFVAPFRKLALWMFVAVLSIGLEARGFADASSATLSLEITDPAGAVIQDATVVIRNITTNQEQRVLSGKSGTTTFTFLKPGHYALVVSKQSFAEITVDNIVLDVGDEKQMRLILKIGSATEIIKVDGNGLNINTTDGSVSTVVERQFVENIPLNGRSFQSLILLTPGVQTVSPQAGSTSGYSGEFSVNGQRTESNIYTVDGVNANTGGYLYGYATSGTSGALPAATALGTTQSLVSVDALQEFRVESSSYSAEYGLSPGGQFLFATRSGTTDVHGTAFDYLRNNYFDANDWFNDNLNKPITALRQNDFGGTLGGPIWIPKAYNGKNRSFFFFSYEGLRLIQPQAALITYVPSISLRQNAPSALQPVLNAFPVPTGSPLSNGLAPFAAAYSLPSSLDSTSLRVDQQVTDKTKLFFRFSDTQSSATSRSTSNLSVLSSAHQSSYTSTLGATAALSGQISNEFRLNYTSNLGGNASTLDSFGGAQPVDLRQLQGLPKTGLSDVSFQFPGYYPLVTQSSADQPQHGWNAANGLVLAYKTQTIKIGVSYRQTGSRLQEPSPYAWSNFNSSQAVLSNSSFSSYVYVFGRSYPVFTNIAAYIQDEIHANKTLALSLGMRWEVNPPPTQSSGILPYVVEGNLENPSSLHLGSPGTRFWNTTYLNFAPRFGISWQAHNEPGRDTVVRFGSGVFFDSGQQTSTQPFGNSPGQSASAHYSNVAYPLTTSQLDVTIANPPVAPYSETFYFPRRLQLPYTLQWNVSIEQALGKEQAITFSYVGSNGRRLLWQKLVAPGTAAPDFVDIYNEGGGTTASYNALQVQFQRTISRGLQVVGSYNWAHSIDYGTQDVDFAQIRGNSDYDLRHNFSAATSYDIPSSSSNLLVRSLVTKWGIDGRFSARTAFPVILDGNQITNPNGQYGYSGLDLVPGVPVYIHFPGLAGNRRINPAAFSLPATGQNGDAPRNFVRGFGANQVDLAVRRTFPIFERLTLQLRAEAFNILNHPNFGYIQPAYGNAQFGEVTKMLDQSLGGMSPLYQQGGPRSMQFAMRLQF